MASKGEIVVDVRRLMTFGLAVYDADGNKVGHVAQYDTDAGWMKVEHRVFAPTDRDLYVPFSAISSIDPREIYLSLTKDVLERDYSTLVHRAPRAGDWAAQLATGMQVLTVLGEDLGTVTHYDPVAGTFVVENRRIAQRTLCIPVALLDSIRSDSGKVFVAVTKADLQQLAQTQPTGMLIVEAARSEIG